MYDGSQQVRRSFSIYYLHSLDLHEPAEYSLTTVTTKSIDHHRGSGSPDSAV